MNEINLGLDLGTTNTISVVYFNGIYRVVPHYLRIKSYEIAENIFPSIVTSVDGELKFGLEASSYYNSDSEVISSLKRRLNTYRKGSTVKIGSKRFDVGEVFFKFVLSVADSVRKSLEFYGKFSNIVFTVPANASSTQRWLVRKAAVETKLSDNIILLDEPVSSFLDYFTTSNLKYKKILIFDLGGGSFDATLMKILDNRFETIRTEGITNLGGNDFDNILVNLVCTKININYDDLTFFEKNKINLEARRIKESLYYYKDRIPKTILFLLGDIETDHFKEDIEIETEKFIKASKKLIQKTIKLTKSLIEDEDIKIYATGGSSIFPPVRDMLRKNFKDVIFSISPLETVATGAAMYAQQYMGKVSSRTARHIGVIRLANKHKDEYFDVIFPKGTKIPGNGERLVKIAVPYHPYHNIGKLKFFEAGALENYDNEERDVRIFSTIFFPYDKKLNRKRNLENVPIKLIGKYENEEIFEEYILDENGIISLKITRKPDNFSINYEILS